MLSGLALMPCTAAGQLADGRGHLAEDVLGAGQVRLSAGSVPVAEAEPAGRSSTGSRSARSWLPQPASTAVRASAASVTASALRMCVFVFKLGSFFDASAGVGRRGGQVDTPAGVRIVRIPATGRIPLSSFLYRLGSFCARRAWLVLLVWLVVVVLVGAGRFTFGARTSNDIRLPGTETQAATDFLAREFPPQQNGQSPVVFYDPAGKLTDPAARKAVEASVKQHGGAAGRLQRHEPVRPRRPRHHPERGRQVPGSRRCCSGSTAAR